MLDHDFENEMPSCLARYVRSIQVKGRFGPRLAVSCLSLERSFEFLQVHLPVIL